MNISCSHLLSKQWVQDPNFPPVHGFISAMSSPGVGSWRQGTKHGQPLLWLCGNVQVTSLQLNRWSALTCFQAKKRKKTNSCSAWSGEQSTGGRSSLHADRKNPHCNPQKQIGCYSLILWISCVILHCTFSFLVSPRARYSILGWNNTGKIVRIGSL